MATYAVPAELRTDSGKGASRRLRRTGQVPAILYGSNAEPVMLSISKHFLAKATEDESFFTAILELVVGKKKQKAILRDIHRHPWKSEILHLDMQRISDTETLRLNIPVHFIDEQLSAASKTSGVVISHQLTDIEVECLPKDLPEFLAVNLSELETGGTVHLSDIKLPEGVSLPGLEAGSDNDAIVVIARHVRAGQGEGGASEEESVEAASDEAPES